MKSDQEKKLEPNPVKLAGRVLKLCFGIILVILFFGVLFLWRLLSQNQAAVIELEAKIENDALKEKALQQQLHQRVDALEESLTLKTNELMVQIEANQESFSEKIGNINWFSFDQTGAVRHARYLLNRAQQALLWSRNTSYAISLLEQTRKFLLSAKREEYEKAIGLISQQVTDLKLGKSDNNHEIHFMLDSMFALINSLDLVKTEFLIEEESSSSSDGFWGEVWDSLEKYINVRFTPDVTDGVGLSNRNDGELLKLRWKLYLQEIRYAILSQDQELYLNLLNDFGDELLRINLPTEDGIRVESIISDLSSYDVGPIPSKIDLILNLPELDT